MARMTAQYCLWTILFVSQMTLLRANAIEVRTHRLPIEIDHLLVLPAPHQSQFKSNQIGELLENHCDFLSRTMATNQPASQPRQTAEISPRRGVDENDLPPNPKLVDADQSLAEFASTCPMEFSDAADCQPIVPASNDTSIKKLGQYLVETRQIVASHRDDLILAPRWLQQEIGAFDGRIRDSVSSVADLMVARINTAFAVPASSQSPMTRVSHAKVIAQEVPTASTTESIVEEIGSGSIDVESINQESIEEFMTQPINIEDSMDPYWQYYEDCDRWGVNFAMRLSEPSIANGDFDVELPSPNQNDEIAADLPFQPAVETGTHQSNLQLLFQSVSAIGDDAWQAVQNWIDAWEFHSVELKGVDLDSIQNSELPATPKGWWEDFQIEVNYQIEILTCNFSEIIASLRQPARDARGSVAGIPNDTRK